MKIYIKKLIVCFLFIAVIISAVSYRSSLNTSITSADKYSFSNTASEYAPLPGENTLGFIYSGITKHEQRLFSKIEEGEENEKESAGPNKVNEFYRILHYPYGEILPRDVNAGMEEELMGIESESDITGDALYDKWENAGPSGMPLTINPSMKYSGRIRDIEITSGGTVKFASASGGLWRISGSTVIEFGQGINSLWYGALATDPNNQNIVLAGTGEPYIGPGGSGLWRTTNLGVTWINIAMDAASQYPLSFYKIKFQPLSSTIVHAATGSGYQRSTNGGLNWTRHLTGIITDIAINPSNTNMIFAGIEDASLGGVYRSTNGGINWTKITGTALPVTDVGDVKISISSSSPAIMFANIVKRSTSTTYGIYKSTDGGTSWGSGSIYSGGDFHWGQGWYNNCIEVSPGNANYVILGGGGFLRTTNGGINWLTLSGYPEFHADQHDVAWNSTGTVVYVANDGGLIQSTDNGLTWSTALNNPPITQFYGVSTPKNEKAVIIGGTQDNFAPVTSNNGASWWVMGAGDASGSAVNPSFANEMYFTNFFPVINRYKTTNYGANFTGFNSGIPSGSGMWGSIRQDIVPQIYLFTNQGAFVYRSIFPYTSWTPLNASAFPGNVSSLDVSRFNGTTVVYASLSINPPAAGNKLRVFDDNIWYERSTGLPSGANVRSVGQHPVNNNIAYAVMNGINIPGQKIYKTTNRGVNWSNISGNMPDIPLTSLVPHPTASNTLYVSSEKGCFKTTNNGVSWIRWNLGMHDNLLVSELTYIDSTAINNRFYIVAGTYGRSIYIRNAGSEDPLSGTNNNNTNIPNRYFLYQNYPNPFNPATKIKFDLPASDIVTIQIIDITGKQVRELENNKQYKAGSHEVNFNAEDLSSGVYLCRIITRKYTDVKKMVLLK